jgi:hypothetical protein
MAPFVLALLGLLSSICFLCLPACAFQSLVKYQHGSLVLSLLTWMCS